MNFDRIIIEVDSSQIGVAIKECEKLVGKLKEAKKLISEMNEGGDCKTCSHEFLDISTHEEKISKCIKCGLVLHEPWSEENV